MSSLAAFYKFPHDLLWDISKLTAPDAWSQLIDL